MPRTITAVLGIANIVPLMYVVYFISFMSRHAEKGGEDFGWILPLHFGVMLWNIVLIAVYLVIAYRSEAVPNDKRAFWAVVLFMGNMVAFPVFWYLYLWRRGSSMNNRAF